MQAQLAPFSHLVYLTGVRVPELFSDDLILELSAEIYGDAELSAQQQAELEEDDLNFSLEEAEALMAEEDDDDWDEDAYQPPTFPVQRWDIVARGVTEKRLEVGFDVQLRLSSDAWPLRLAAMPAAALMYATAPASKPALLADLFGVHGPEWGAFGKYGLGGNLDFGCGVFAEGPRPLMEAYAGVLQAHGMRPRFMNANQDELPPPALCLLLDEDQKCYVLADSFRAIRRAELDTEPAE